MNPHLQIILRLCLNYLTLNYQKLRNEIQNKDCYSDLQFLFKEHICTFRILNINHLFYITKVASKYLQNV